MPVASFIFFFFFNDTATTEIYTLSLHDALPILAGFIGLQDLVQLGEFLLLVFHIVGAEIVGEVELRGGSVDRKSTRLNSSHQIISYAVFCLKKKKKKMSDLSTLLLILCELSMIF